MEVLAAIVLFFVLTILIVIVRKRNVDSETLQDWANLVTVSSVISAVFLGLVVGIWYLIRPAVSDQFQPTATLTLELPVNSSATDTMQSMTDVADSSPTLPSVNTLQPTETFVPTMAPTRQLETEQTNSKWNAEYFNNRDFQEPATYTRQDSWPSFDWAEGNPAPDIYVDNFSIRWTRCSDFEDRYYIFTARADDYISVYVDDIQVLEANNAPFSALTRPFAISAGSHCIKIEYKEYGQGANIYFDYEPGETFISADENAAWNGEYFNNRDLREPAAYTRNDISPNFDWKEGNPAPGVSFDNFSVRWTRCLDLDEGTYIFSARADDYIRVLVDDIQVLELNNNVLSAVSIPFAVSGDSHCIKVEYREYGGSANIYFDYERSP